MFFVDISKVNWWKFSTVIAAVTLFWVGMQGVIPEPWHDKTMIVLAAVQAAFTFLMKATHGPIEPQGGAQGNKG